MSRPRSGSLRFFEQMAGDLGSTLRDDVTSNGRTLHGEAEALAATFRAWLAAPPTESDRLETVSRLVDLQRRVREHRNATGQGSKPPSAR